MNRPPGRYGKGGYFLDVEEIAERERPPMLSLPAYLERNLHSTGESFEEIGQV